MQVSLGDFGTNVFPTDAQLTNFISKIQPSLQWSSKLSHLVRSCSNHAKALSIPLPAVQCGACGLARNAPPLNRHRMRRCRCADAGGDFICGALRLVCAAALQSPGAVRRQLRRRADTRWPRLCRSRRCCSSGLPKSSCSNATPSHSAPGHTTPSHSTPGNATRSHSTANHAGTRDTAANHPSAHAASNDHGASGPPAHNGGAAHHAVPCSSCACKEGQACDAASMHVSAPAPLHLYEPQAGNNRYRAERDVSKARSRL